MKLCTRCGNPKGSSANKSWCKECVRADSRARYAKGREKKLAQGRRWYEANRESRIAQTGEYHRAHPEMRRESARRYRHNNPDKTRARQRAYYSANRDRCAALAQKYRSANPLLYIVANHNERARRMGLEGELSVEAITALFGEFGWRCAGCGTHASEIEAIYRNRTVLLEIDHIVPVSRGGANDISNIQPLCQKCNNWKRHKTIDYRPEEIRQKYANSVAA